MAEDGSPLLSQEASLVVEIHEEAPPTQEDGNPWDFRLESMKRRLNSVRDKPRCDQHYLPEYTNSDFRPRIMKVPEAIRRGNEAAYTPKFVSIGPYHCNNPELQRAEALKWRYLHDLIQRSPLINSLDRYMEVVRERVGEARRYYMGGDVLSSISDDQFVEMLVLDGCFIVEFLINDSTYLKADFGFNLSSIRYDLQLLENQIPFFVLQLLVDKTENIPHYATHQLFVNKKYKENYTQGNKNIYHFLHLGHRSIVRNLGSYRERERKLRCYRPKRIWMHVCRILGAITLFLAFILVIWRIPPIMEKNKTGVELFCSIPNATKLTEFGVSIRRKWGNWHSQKFPDVFFDEEAGRLEIPPLELNKSSFCTFRNLIAFEQCCMDEAEKYITMYAYFMNQLIATAEDVAILEKYGIITNDLGSREEVVNFFAHICSGAVYDINLNYLLRVRWGLSDHCSSFTNRLRAELATTFALTYGYTPKRWILASIFGAMTILVFTGIQTLFTVLSYYHG